MKYFVTAGMNARWYTEQYIDANSEAEAKEIFTELAMRHRVKWEVANERWDSLEIFADADKEVQS
jgi:hypothetical protein